VVAGLGLSAPASAAVTRATRLLARAAPPVWLAAMVDLAAGQARLRFGAVAAARAQLRRADRHARALPGATALQRWTADALADVGAVALRALENAEPLTVAELRVLRLLPSHLTFREIGERFATSSHTVKSQAHAVYRKLGARSRSEAVDRAVACGLLDPGGVPSTFAGP
jgi:LuxR family maltose regulon positive regulatory protein